MMEPEDSAPKKKRQIDIGAFFGAHSKVKPNDNRNPNNLSSINEQQKKVFLLRRPEHYLLSQLKKNGN